MCPVSASIPGDNQHFVLPRFDVPAMVHKFDIGSGGVRYSNAKLNRGTEAHIRRTGQLPEFDGTFGQPPASGLMGRAISGMTGRQALQISFTIK